MPDVPAAPTMYCDNSALGRVTDTAPQLRTEAGAVLRLLRAVQDGQLRLLSSRILYEEIVRSRRPELIRVRIQLLELAYASVLVPPTRSIAASLLPLGFKIADALHVAAAAIGSADVLVSCDDHFIRRAARVSALLGPRPAIMTPADAVRRFGL